jgi:hypothetical protein
MAVSRWERGRAKPPADAYIRLGNIADDPLCWLFWGHAGLSTADVMRVLPSAGRRLRQGRVANVPVVHAGAGRKSSLRPPHFVAIPILPAHVATPGTEAEEVADLDQLRAEGLWAAPAEWCPNPTRTINTSIHAAIHTFPVLSNVLQKGICQKFAKSPGRRTPARLLSSTALSSIYTPLIPRACDPNPRVLRETSREI